ncbi:MAG: hypothetical protein AUJ12_06620 [Alphaproteobacteria bacterium CG1_02_46_17]|nr:MAG: hypothetical protein AUJ12_06620 [Alphaproteobacteria bacterium CG1_02_46_17]
MHLTETFGKVKFVSLDFTRGIASFIVAAAHFSPYGGYKFPELLGGFCVGYFFILPGFVLTHAYHDQICAKTYSFREFIVARFARLYPLHFLTFVLVLCYWIAVSIAVSMGVNLNTTAQWSWLTIFENISLTQILFSGKVSFNSPSWSIGIEFWSSMLVFFLCLPIKTIYKLTLICIFSTLYLLTLPQGGFITSHSQFAFGFIEKNLAAGGFLFSLGWVIFHVHRYLANRKIVATKILSWGIIPILLIAIIFPPVSFHTSPWVELFYFLFIALIVLMLSLTPAKHPRISDAMGNLGDLSYGIYLWHMPIMLGATAVCKIIQQKFGIDILATPLGIILYFSLVILVAFISYHAFEKPSKKFIRHFFEKKNDS